MEAVMADRLTQDLEMIRGAVRERYAAAARSVTAEDAHGASCGGDPSASCCGADAGVISDDQGRGLRLRALWRRRARRAA
jgi:hypothetical protein